MDFRDVVFGRRSVRKFSDKKVEDEKIQLLMEYAMSAPSAANRKPYAFYIVKNKSMIEKLKMVTPHTNMNSQLIIIACGETKDLKEDRARDFYVQDVSACIENLLLGGVNEGLSTCWCGLHPIEESKQKVRVILNLDMKKEPVALIHVGYALEEPQARTQFDTNKVVVCD